MAYHRFLSRTIKISDGNNIKSVESAHNLLYRALVDDGIVRKVELQKRHEIPSIKKRREAYEKSHNFICKALKDKIDFILKGTRKETPWP